MPWFTIDDKWHSHPKVIGLSLAAAGLWAKAGSWCNDQLTDGRISLAAVKVLGGNTKLAAELVEANLWHVVEGGWQFHDWLDKQQSRETVLSKRKADAERKRKGNETRKGIREESERSPPILQLESSRPSPSPSPIPIKNSEKESARATPRVDHWSANENEHSLRVEFIRRYEAAVQNPPMAGPVTKMSAALAGWVESTAAIRGMLQSAVITQLFDGFFASDSARAKKFPPAFLATNPAEYFEPSKPEVAGPTLQQQIAMADAEVRQLMAAYEKGERDSRVSPAALEALMDQAKLAAAKLGELKKSVAA